MTNKLEKKKPQAEPVKTVESDAKKQDAFPLAEKLATVGTTDFVFSYYITELELITGGMLCF